ncbi:ABC transporter permease [Sphaerisporangium rufum]|uniref:Autoinducer 2 import system permease protein LsrD n=1 Tax=Sphaerisporangium rufum TaxID=1381558 RepID=A0A919R7B6_9ACTN|nr:ABC transporter permease [Sphaerisporangium rufum]GII78502.1 ABC transporter permease [Sphaerisporangium rufum]
MTASAAPAGGRGRWTGEYAGIWIALGVLFAASAFIAPGTLRQATLAGMLPLAGILVIAGIGQTLVVQQRGFDLSLPATMSLCGLTSAAMARDGLPLPLAVLVPLGIALLIGGVNGILVIRLSITPLIATLATNALLLGAVWAYSGGLPVAAPDGLTSFVRSSVAGIPTVAVLAAALVAAAAVAERRSVLGRNFVIVGASPPAARAAGVHVPAHIAGAYVLSALCAGLAGVLLMGYAGSATTSLGDSYLLPVIAAVVVGGTPLSGGRGSLVATAAAAVFLTQLGQVTLALGAPTSSQLLVQSASIVLAVVLRSVRRRARRRVSGQAPARPDAEPAATPPARPPARRP